MLQNLPDNTITKSVRAGMKIEGCWAVEEIDPSDGYNYPARITWDSSGWELQLK